MMFLQFMLVASFWVQLSGYLNNMNVAGTMFALIMSTMAIGSLFSPLAGMFADRIANAERVLFVLNALVAIFLLLCFFATSPVMIFVWLVLAMCAYMPTWGLTSSIAISNSTAEAFPLIRVFGSFGWVSAAVFALCAKGIFGEVIDGTSVPLACGAGVAAVAAVFALFLPATPPQSKGKPMSVSDAFGLEAFSLLKDKNMAIFMFCVVVWTVAFTIYWMYASFLTTLGVEQITTTLNTGQISEMLFMLLLPFSVKFLGLKNTMGLGILAMLVRYGLSAYATDSNGLYWGAILVHGIIFGFFFVAAQMYIAKKSPKSLEAQAQGLFFFFYGLAQIIGTFFSTWLIESNTTQIAVKVGNVAASATVSTDWNSVFIVETVITAALLVFYYVFFNDSVAKKA